MKRIDGWIQGEGPFNHCFHDRSSTSSDVVTFISKGYIEREMNIEAQIVTFGEFYKTVNVDGVRNTVRAFALEKDQFDLIEKRSQPDDIGDDLVRIDVRGRRKLKGKSSPIILEHP
jgi:hypothetical protein